MSQFNFEKIHQQLNNGRDIRDFKQYFKNDEFALNIINFNRDYFKYFEKYVNDKYYVKYFLQYDKDYRTLLAMSNALKNDVSFALEIFEIDNLAMVCFDESVKNSEVMLTKYLEYISNTSKIIFANELYKYKEVELLNVVKAKGLFFELPNYIKEQSKVIRDYIENSNILNEKFYRISLPEDIKEDFHLNIEILSKINIDDNKRENIFKNTIIKTIVNAIRKDKDNLNIFLKEYTGVYDILIMNGLSQNKDFKSKYKHLLKEYPDEKDFKPYMREMELENKLLSNNKEDTIRNKRKI